MGTLDFVTLTFHEITKHYSKEKKVIYDRPRFIFH